jgi:undecaprenyl-diphosphatase
MNDLLTALLLGIIEGITEFLPVSSTGHLLIAERWLGHRSDLFNIAIQAGAILAVTWIYRERLWSLLVGFGKPANRDYALKLATSFGVTAIGGLLVKAFGWELPHNVRPIAWALIIGALWMMVAEYFAAKRAAREGERTAISWTTAILVGIAQVVAGVFPGTSRSAATIFVALLAGTTSRAAATEFAFLVGIPTMFAATGYEVLSLIRHDGIGNEDWTALAVAFVAAAITAFVAVKWLLHYIQSHRFTAFAVYRLVIGAALLLWLPAAA